MKTKIFNTLEKYTGLVSAAIIPGSMKFFTILILLLLNSNVFAQTTDQRAENIQNGTFNIFMSADGSYYKGNSASDNNPYGYGYWVTAHALETLADAYQRTRNPVYRDRMKNIIAGIRKYNLYSAGTYHNDYYDDLEWLCLATFNCYNATKDPEFLDAVHQIWAEIKTGYANGAMSWRKGCTTPCNNSIANGPAIIIAVKLYQLEGDNANLQMAKDIHAWMKANVLNAQGGIWDSPGNLNPDWQFSYNSGMFIGACLELSIVTGAQSYIDDGIKASEFMMNYRNYNGGVFFLNEKGQGDGGLFKGIFAKYFTEFVRVGNLTQVQKDRYLQVINYTGDYAWANSVNKSNFLISPDWSALPGGTIDLSTQVSGVHLFESVASLNKVHVYQNINYAGFYSQLPLGSYTLAQLQSRGVVDNDITSLTIPTGYAVTVYENDNFTGASKTFTSNTAWLADWNDRITSLQITDISVSLVNVYQDVNFGGYSAGLGVGDYNLSQLQAKGVLDNDITSLKITEGFKVTLYDGDNFTGTSKDFTSTTSWIADWNDKATSIRIRTNGDATLSGTYYLQNRNSSLYMDVWGALTTDGANIAQGTFNGGANQQYQFTHLGDGTYQVLATHSMKSVDVSGISKDDGANVQQWTYNGTPNQQFIMVSTGDGFYKMIPKHSGKLVEVANASIVNAANVQQFTNNNQTCGMWKLVPIQAVNGNGDGLTANFFNGMNFETPVYSEKDATINVDWGNGSPNALVNADQFSARWTGQIQPRYSDVYTFHLNSDNGRRLWINGQLVIDKWIDDWGIDYTGTITLTAGQKYDIKIEYFENNGGANCKFEWSSTLQAREVVPQSQLYSNPLPSVVITSPANNASFTAPASIVINATATDNGTVAKVDFYNGGTLISSDNTSPYSATWSNVAVGTYTITARATDNSGAVTSSSAITVQVIAPVNVATFYQHCNYDAAGYGIGLPVGNYTMAQMTAKGILDNDISSVKVQSGYQVTLYADDNFTGTSMVLTADNSCLVSNSFNDIVTSIKVSVISTVTNIAPSVSITSPANNASFNAPATITINATASDADGTVSKVDFYNGGTLLGSDNSSPYSFVWSNAGAGTYSVAAKATDNSNAVTSSSAITVVVNAVIVTNQVPSVSVTSPANNTSFNAPATITINATASDADGTVSKVDFYNGGTLLGSDNSSPYSFVWSNVGAGTYNLTAKATDNSNAVTTSGTVTVVVNTVVTNSCSGVAQYVENGGYVAGSVVQNSGSKYQCKPYPYTGWCNGAAWAYAPGTGTAWADAWTLLGSCAARVATSDAMIVSPNPVSDIVNINIETASRVIIYNSMGAEVISAMDVEAQGSINVSGLSSGMYLIKIDTGSEVITKTIVKN